MSNPESIKEPILFIDYVEANPLPAIDSKKIQSMEPFGWAVEYSDGKVVQHEDIRGGLMTDPDNLPIALSFLGAQ